MKSQVITDTFSVTQADVLYVAQQLNLDLQSLSKAYPSKLSLDYAMNLFNSCSILLYNFAVSHIGFSIHDPDQKNLVYHELRYEVVYGGDVVAIAPNGGRGGRGGRQINPVWVPNSAVFSPWVTWSQSMLSKSEYEQSQIVAGTLWGIPGKSGHFSLSYEGITWRNTGNYYSGNIGAKGSEGTKK